MGGTVIKPAALGRFTAMTDGAVMDQAIKNNVGATEDNAITTTAMDGNASIITQGGYHYIIAGYDTRKAGTGEGSQVSVIGAKIPVTAIDYRQSNPFNNTLDRQKTAIRTAENNYYLERVVAPKLETGETFYEPIEASQEITLPTQPNISYTVETNQEITRVSSDDLDYGLAVNVRMFVTDDNGKTNPVIFSSGGDFKFHPVDQNGNTLRFDTPSDFQLYIQESFDDDMSSFIYSQAINAASAQADITNVAK